MQAVLDKLAEDYPYISFTAGRSLHWSAEDSSISYPINNLDESGLAGLLHEVGHARLGHKIYISDMDLVIKEREAWNEALKLSKRYGVSITNDHIEDCIDTYREWLYRRSLCPVCSVCGVQANKSRYVCLNCDTDWKVSASRHCRPYRLKKIAN